MAHALRRECDRLGLPHLTPHGLRDYSLLLALLDTGMRAAELVKSARVNTGTSASEERLGHLTLW